MHRRIGLSTVATLAALVAVTACGSDKGTGPDPLGTPVVLQVNGVTEPVGLRDNNGDTDIIDDEITLRDRTTGASQPLGAPAGCGIAGTPEGRAVVRASQAPFGFSAGATLHFQFTASSSPGSIVRGGAAGFASGWAYKLPPASQRGAIRNKPLTIEIRITVTVPKPELPAMKNHRASNRRTPREMLFWSWKKNRIHVRKEIPG